MLIYVNGVDNRTKQLVTLLQADGNTVGNDRVYLSSCDVAYLGKDGQEFEQVDFNCQATVLTLLKNQHLAYISKLKGFKYDYLYRDSLFVEENTYICDEALIAYLIIDNPTALVNKNILILGYGHCGQDLAKKLSAFKAKISIANRAKHHHEEVVQRGFRYIPLKKLFLDDFDLIINTIPCNILTKELLKNKKNNCQIYDIASYPYGMNKVLRDEHYHLMKQLPTKYAYKSSALALYWAIQRMIKNVS